MKTTMSMASACSELKAALTQFGFVQRKPTLFWGRTDEVLQVVRMGKVKRVADAIEIGMELWSPFGTSLAQAQQITPSALVNESMGDRRCSTSIWKLARFSARDVAWQAGQVGAAFTFAADIARHHSDRYQEQWISETLKSPVDLTQLDRFAAPRLRFSNTVNAPTEAETNAMLRALEVDLFQDTWERHPGVAGHWMSKQEDGGFRYCAYLMANRTGTLASVYFYSANSADLGTSASMSSLSAISRATKYAVTTGTSALQLPVLNLAPDAIQNARELLRGATEEFPANTIRPVIQE